MADIQNYLSLLSALTSSNNVQSMYYNNYDPYSAANLYGSGNNGVSFSNIFANSLNALQNSNASLLSELASSLSDSISETGDENLAASLEEASKDDCDCLSADLVKQLYADYFSDAKTKTALSKLLSPADTSSQEASGSKSETEASASLNVSIPTEEEIDSMIAQSISIPMQ